MAYARKYTGPDRRRYTTFRLLAVLQFGTYKDIIEVRDGGEVRVHSIAKLARKLHMRPARFREALEWLCSSGYIHKVEPMTAGLGCFVYLAQPTNIINKQVIIHR